MAFFPAGDTAGRQYRHPLKILAANGHPPHASASLFTQRMARRRPRLLPDPTPGLRTALDRQAGRGAFRWYGNHGPGDFPPGDIPTGDPESPTAAPGRARRFENQDVTFPRIEPNAVPKLDLLKTPARPIACPLSPPPLSGTRENASRNRLQNRLFPFRRSHYSNIIYICQLILKSFFKICGSSGGIDTSMGMRLLKNGECLREFPG